MTRYEFTFTGKRVSEAEEFSEASVQELRALIALYELGGVCDEDELLAASGISKARLASALALWQEAGVIAQGVDKKSLYRNKITEEFDTAEAPDELYEETTLEVAENIRSKSLASLMDMCAAMMGKLMLSPTEVKRISGLCSQYALSEEYVAILAAHLAEKECLTVTRLVSRAIRLTEKDINTPLELEEYLSAMDREKTVFMTLRKALGIYDRKLSKTEEGYFRKWTDEYGYGSEIVGEAYDITVMNTGKLSFPYMETLLSDWNSHSCTSLIACRERYEEAKRERDAEYSAQADTKKSAAKAGKSAKKAPKPRYGDFDPEEAFKQALLRSFPMDEIDDEDN